MRRTFGLFLLVALCALSQAPQRPDGLYAEVQTAKGLIVFQLKPDSAPMAVANFVGLAEGTIANAALDPGQPFFDNSTFHRVVAGHVIQTGIPHSDRARGPGYNFPNEIDARLSHNHAGAVNMANGGPNTNASQWCITLGDRSYLDGDFTIFGEVVQGLDVVLSIRQGDALQSVRILRVGAAAQAYHPTTASFQAMVDAAKLRVAQQVQLKAQAEQAWIAANAPKAVAGPGGVLVETLAQAPPGADASGALNVRYRGREIRYVGDWTGRTGPPIATIAFASGPNGVPGFRDQPETFLYTPGTSKINPGVDAVMAGLKPGDRRRIIVPAALAYGRAGLYPPVPPGQPRFVVSPNAMMEYDVEVLPSGSGQHR